MKNSKAANLISSLCSMLAALASAPFIVDASDRLYESGMGLAYLVVAASAFALIHYLLAIILHEAGHCVAGLMTGYSFVSFRVGTLTFVRTGKGIGVRRLHLQGTAGQCIMAPPELKGGRMPVIFYNMGGALMNLIAAGISLVFCLTSGSPLAVLFFSVSLLFELMLGLTNGIPMYIGGVNNDGMNALEMSRNPRAVRAFWIQLKVSQMLSLGVRVKDMPEEWFELPAEDEMDNTLCATLAVLRSDRLMDMREYAAALDLAGSIIDGSNSVMQLHRNMLECDRITASLLLGNGSFASKMTDPDFSRFILSMRSSPSVARTGYVYELLFTRDTEKAGKYKDRFESVAPRFPYECEIASEREKMADADALFAAMVPDIRH